MSRLVDQDERERIRTLARRDDDRRGRGGHGQDERAGGAAGRGARRGARQRADRRRGDVHREGGGRAEAAAARRARAGAAGWRRSGSARRANLDEAVAHLEEARLSTIHGFCNDLLHERPVEALVDPRFVVLTEPEAEALYRRAFDRWIEAQLEAPPEGLRRALRRRATLDDGDPVERLRRAGWTLADWRDFRAPWRREAFDREAAIDALVERVHAFASAARARARPPPTASTPTRGSRGASATTCSVSEPLAPRDHDGARGGAGRAGAEPPVPAAAKGL